MESSPNPIKRNSRLSFSSKHRLSDSPKTPIRNKKLAPNDGFETPPSLSKLNNDNCFGEESPSQDYDYSLIPMSQDIITRYRDVTWKWNDENDTQQTNTSKSKKELRPAIVQQKVEKSTGIFEAQQKIDKTKGFYKFQELLLAEGGNLKKLINKNHKINSDNKCNSNSSEQLESSFKENIDTIRIHDNLGKRTTKVELKPENKIKFDINKLLPKSSKKEHNKKDELVNIEGNLQQDDIIDLLDDSDSDNLLVELSQTIENNIQYTKSTTESEGSMVVNIGKRKTNLTNIKKTSHFDNDSIDELLLTLPMDEDINTLSNNCDMKIFTRHNSMPPQFVQAKNPPNNALNTLLRHSSANCIRTQRKISPKSVNGDGKLSPFSDGSLESVYTTASDHIPLSKKCTKAEVEMKRQEAKLRRLQSQKRKELTQKPQLTKK